MPSKRVIQAGHILALVFIALLLVGARGFLGAHPVLSGVLLALVAPVYYVAARVTGHRQFLHPSVLLGILGFQLLTYGAGVSLGRQPLVSLLPIGLLFLAAKRAWVKRIPDGAVSLMGAINFAVAVFSLWIGLEAAWFFAHAPLAAFIALAGYAAYSLARFASTERVGYALAMVGLGTGSFLFLLYSYPSIALGCSAVAGVVLMWDVYRRGMAPLPETVAFTIMGVYLLFMAVSGGRATQVPLGYLVLAGTWLHLGLVFHNPELPPLAGPHPAPLPRLLPLFGAGMLLPLLAITLTYPWSIPTLTAPFLTIAFFMFFVTGRELGKQSLSLIGVGLARALAALARVAPWAVFLYLAWQRFPASYRIGVGSMALALVSLLAAWRQVPQLLARRNLYAYQAAVFATIAYFLAEKRLGINGIAGTLIGSGGLIVFAILAFAYVLRNRIPPAFLMTLYDSACLPAAVACVLLVRSGELSATTTLWVGLALVLACVVIFTKVRLPSVVFTLPVVLGLWIYAIEWAAGVRGEMLGLPYLIFGFACAAVGYALLRRGNRWNELLYFMWFLCTGVSLALFWPMRAGGAYAAPLWPIAFLLVARAVEGRRDLAFSVALESLSVLFAAASIVVLCIHALYAQVAIALVVYAVLYFWVSLGRRIESYLYPAAACVVASSFFAVMAGGYTRLFLPYFLPLAVVMYLVGAWARRRGLLQIGRAFELAVSTGAAIGALLFLTLPFASYNRTGMLTGLAFLAVYVFLSTYTRNRVFMTGIGLAGAFALYELLPLLPKVNRGNRLAFFVPVALVLVLLGRRQHRARDPRGGWGLYTAAIIVTVFASVFALWPQPADPGASRVVLLIAIAVWPVLLVWTANEVFIHCATIGLAFLAYHFVQSSTDMFGQHLMAFFLFGTVLLGLIFLGSAARQLMRFRRPTLLVSPTRWYGRVVYLVPVAVLGVATFGSWGVSSSSNPHFCGTCHNMGAYFSNWKRSPHAKADISCANCHYDPGITGFMRAKVKGASQLVATVTGSARNKPEAQVSNATCLHSGCHSIGQLARPVMMRSIRFEHQAHLGMMSLGPQLRCTSCHASVDPDTHFAVDTNTCFTCHFSSGSSGTQPTSDKRAHMRNTKATGSCLSCHQLPRGGAAFDHVAAGIKAEDTACASCHEGVVSGTAAVEARQCRHCHIERAAQLMRARTVDIHDRHIMGQGVSCDWCHGAVTHGRQLDKIAGLN